MKRTSRKGNGTYEPLLERLHDRFDKLSPQLQAAASFLIDRPEEVALLSMREQARIAGVQPVTMTRLAQRLGFPGFDELKKLFADGVRGRGSSFSSRSLGLLARQKAVGDAGLVSNYIDVLISHLERLKDETALRAFVESVNCLQKAVVIYALGLRSMFPVAYQFSYVQSYFSNRVVLLDGPGGIGLDRIQRAPEGSALLIISMRPYAASSIALARRARQHGIKVVAITDSTVSPAARTADVVNVVGTASPSFFDTITPAFAVSEILVALLAARVGPEVTALIENTESQLRDSGIFWRESLGGNTSRNRSGAKR
jgi:DNA-binding MurR/RpiR family transcriptional regulator